jgi:hypothetical protein
METRIGSKKPSKKTNQQNKKQGDSFEGHLSRRLKMKRQPGSGCGRLFKEDLVDQVYLGQAKSTRAPSITIKLSDLNNVRTNAKEKTPILFIGFFKDTQIWDDRIWVAVPIRHWSKIRGRKHE